MNLLKTTSGRRTLLFASLFILALSLESCGLFKENCDCPSFGSKTEKTDQHRSWNFPFPYICQP